MIAIRGYLELIIADKEADEKINVDINSFTRANTSAEGFTGMAPFNFVFEILIDKCGLVWRQPVNRITFRYVDENKK